jgi:hypothetical protein
MRIFRHRGDIYISKANKKDSKETRILLFLLLAIVVFTAVFLITLFQKYDSLADFFVGDEVVVDQQEEVSQISLPAISGKDNFLYIETDDDNTVVHYAMLIQADSDNLAYKICTLNPQTEINGKSINDIYVKSGSATLLTEISSYLGIEINFYAQLQDNKLNDLLDEMGKFVYPSSDTIRFNGGENDDTYTVRIKEGNQNFDGNRMANTIRYFTIEQQNYAKANEIMYYALTQLFNEDNRKNGESLFRYFITCGATNITVRDFADRENQLLVFSNSADSIVYYSVEPEYENGFSLTQSSQSNIKGYFSE